MQSLLRKNNINMAKKIEFIIYLIYFILSSGIFFVHLSVYFSNTFTSAIINKFEENVDEDIYINYKYYNKRNNRIYYVTKEINKDIKIELINKKSILIRYSTIYPFYTILKDQFDEFIIYGILNICMCIIIFKFYFQKLKIVY